MIPATPHSFAHLPGGEYVAEGLADLACGKESIASLLLTIAAGRLTEAGLPIPATGIPDPELRLYRLLREVHCDDAHAQYNAHLRRLARLCHALEARPKFA
jgi:hypothetical protein